MLRTLLLFLVISLPLACRTAPRDDVDKQARAFVRAAAFGDTAALRELTADSQPLIEAATVRRLDPQLLSLKWKQMTYVAGRSKRDTANCIYWIGQGSQAERITLGLTYHRGKWLVYSFGFPDRQ